MKRITGIAAIAAALSITQAPSARACAGLESEGAPPIKVNSEAAIIIWDAARQTEHFIRRASFDSSGQSMGFLVPTPGTPTVTTASDDLFGTLDRTVEARTETRVRSGYRFDWLLLPDAREPQNSDFTYFEFEDAPDAKAARPHPNRATSIGGYTATVLAARNERELERWLRTNKFKTDAATRAWLRPYVQKGWSITAFKIPPGKTATELSPVRLSFKTAKPYYPYREPASARTPGNYAAARTLKVYYLAPERAVATIGDAQPASWPGRLQWSARLDATRRGDLEKGTALQPWQIPADARLTVFNDTASPRPGTDEVYFQPSSDQSVLAPAPIIQWYDGRTKIPLELVVIALIGISVASLKATGRLFRHK